VVNKSFGSGYFGEWFEDEFGLPAYRYTCDQIKDPKAISPMNEEWRSKTEHLHQVGNDRFVAVVSNYGYVQVRQDEGCPKYLNEFNPKYGQYAGGFGYLTDGENFLSTYYPGNGDSFNRIFGIGYFRKKVKKNGYFADQIIFAPFGDDPILISQIKITNNRNEAKDLRWIEYWGCNMYQFSSLAYSAVLLKKDTKHPRDIRREFSETFSHEFSIISDGSGLQEVKKYNDSDKTQPTSYRKAVYEDLRPPKTFLASLDANADGMSTNSTEFFGKGGVESPDGLNNNLDSDITTSGTKSAMFLERKIHLEPGESQTLYFAFGYIPEGFEINSLLLKYKEKLSQLWSNSTNNWKNNRFELIIPDELWVNRELTWHNYYLRSAMTYDDFFQEYILSQGHVYQYIIGFQGAARDPLQHSLPFVYSNSIIVKSVLRYTLKTVRKSGEIPYAITGNGQILPSPFKPSDQEMWLLWLASEYVLATRDTDFLDEEIVRYPVYGPKSSKVSVRDLLNHCYNHFVKKTGSGKHGLQRLSNGDWNDGVILGHIPSEKHREIQKQAESVLNAAMAIFTLRIYGEMLNFTGNQEMAEKVFKYSESQREAVHSQWNGRWFKRAWLTDELGWIGDDQMWLEPQPWAIIGGAADDEQKKILVRSIDDLVRKPSKIGARLHSKGIETIRGKGQGVNGGIWPSINGTLIWALSLVNGDMAWDEWKKNTLAFHAESYPDIWYGIWSGPDTYNSTLSKYPGQTVFDEALITGAPKRDDEESIGHIGLGWTDFPVFNLHPHAWPLYNTISLIGVKFTSEGVDIAPPLPKEEYEFSSPIIGFQKSKEGYSGWYAPKTEGMWKIKIKLSKEELRNIKTLEVNEREEKVIIEEASIILQGTNKISTPLRWKIRYN
jgi:hypothetical protein